MRMHHRSSPQIRQPLFATVGLNLGVLLLSTGLPIQSAAQTLTLSGQPVDEVVVTARKREELLLEVPVAVTAITAEAIEDLRLVHLNDVARHTPGFSFTAATGRQPASDRPVMRGITTIRNGIANSNAAATFVDGIYLGGSAQSTDLFNLERIEIIRGPQAAQYGRGTFAGAINYVTRRPTSDLQGEVIVTGAEHQTFELTGWLSGPLINERLAFFMAGGHRQYGGEYKNSRDGSTVGGEESNNITTKLYWTPVDELDVTLKLGLQNTDDDHYAIYLQPRALNNCCFRDADAPRAREYFVGNAQAVEQVTLFTDLLNAAGDAGTQLDRELIALDIDWRLPGGYLISSLTGYVSDELERGFDASLAAYDPLSFLPGSFTQVDELEQTDFSQELRLSSPADRALHWSGGVYYYDGRFEETADNRVYLDPSGMLVVAPNFTPLTEDGIENVAVFGSAEWTFARHWNASIELRWARDEITVTNRNNDGTAMFLDQFSEDFSALTPRFTASYSSDEELLYYLNIAKGTNPGDFNPDVPELPDGSPDENFRAVDEEELWNYELGVKGQWWQRRLSGAIATYFLDVKNQQITALVELADGSTATIIQNIGRTAVFGIESEFTAALSERISARATYAYTHAEIRERISTDEADLRGSDGSPEQSRALGDVSGNRVPRVPEHTASVALRYEQPLLDWGSWYLSADYTFESSSFAQEHNLIETGDQNLVGLRTGVSVNAWEVSLWVTNLFDNDTPLDIQRYFDRRSGTLDSFPQQGSRPSSSPRGFGISLPRGRQIGATLRYRF
jgi:outer membrane receptor protein involved in Fe transport